MAKIFLIESSPADAQAAREAIESHGDSVELTGEASQAMDLVRASKPDVLVLCVELETGSGYSICNKVRRDVELARVPLILTSREATPETFEQHRRLKTHADAYLHKPYTQQDLLTAIDKLLKRQSAEVFPDGSEPDALDPDGLAMSGINLETDSDVEIEEEDAQKAGTVEFDLGEEAVRSLALAVDPELGAIMAPQTVGTDLAEADESAPVEDVKAGPDAVVEASGEQFGAQTRLEDAFEEEVFEVSDDSPTPLSSENSHLPDSDSLESLLLQADEAEQAFPEPQIEPQSFALELGEIEAEALSPNVALTEANGARAPKVPNNGETSASEETERPEKTRLELREIRDALRLLLERVERLCEPGKTDNTF